MPLLSPEKTILTVRLAGLGGRILAHLIDLIIVAILITISVVGALFSLQFDEGLSQLVSALISVFGFFAYFILFEGLWNGQTLGKKAMNLRVRSADGTPITFMGAFGRNMLRAGDIVPGFYFVGIVAMFTNPRAQRMGDLIAGTIVCYEAPALPIFAPSPHQAGVHRFESAVGELRGMTDSEYLALRRYCDRYPELPVEVQIRLTRELWGPFARRHGIEPIAGVAPIQLAEAVVMRYGRIHGLL